MKKVLLTLFLAVSVASYGQSLKGSLVPQEQYIPGNPLLQHRLNKDLLSDWYIWVEGATNNNGLSFSSFSNYTLFPDSSVKQIYGDGNGGTVLGYNQLHSAGQAFDPKSSAFGENALSIYNPYTWDSLAFFFYYKHLTADTGDMLKFQFYTSATGGITKGTFSTPTATWYVGYDATKNNGTKSVANYTYHLGIKDTNSTFKAIVIPVDSIHGGLKMKAGDICAFTVTYIPGYKYALGDTIDDKWTTPVPQKKLNHLKLPIYSDAGKTVDEDKFSNPTYNGDLEAKKPQRYKLTGSEWGGWYQDYYPGNAWNAYNLYLYSGFHITSGNFGIANADGLKGNIHLYPNPANEELNVALNTVKATKVNIKLTDITGRELQNTNVETTAGAQNIKLNTSNLQPGMYFCTVNGGGASQTMKFMVAR